ncbi:MAG TPA: hypothetical protein VNZ49_12925 [Bacteroidia bacterium]|jgi:hypothetical protein|nr:hypothetical protein [Bacteroidia bacterium]
MADYKIIEAEAREEVHIKVNSQYNNLNADVVIVEERITARLFGTISELLVVKKDAVVYIHGTIKGKTENQGGKIHVY